jgi:hypothetical protein
MNRKLIILSWVNNYDVFVNNKCHVHAGNIEMIRTDHKPPPNRATTS